MKHYGRYFEIIFGVVIACVLLGKYCSAGECRSLLSYIIPIDGAQPFAAVILVIIASRLIAGNPKDYSKFFYNLLVKIFGDPYKNKRNGRRL